MALGFETLNLKLFELGIFRTVRTCPRDRSAEGFIRSVPSYTVRQTKSVVFYGLVILRQMPTNYYLRNH